MAQYLYESAVLRLSFRLFPYWLQQLFFRLRRITFEQPLNEAHCVDQQPNLLPTYVNQKTNATNLRNLCVVGLNPHQRNLHSEYLQKKLGRMAGKPSLFLRRDVAKLRLSTQELSLRHHPWLRALLPIYVLV